MSDLSRLLDDVYSSGPARTPAAPPAPDPAPEPELPWASETTMDDAFADWVPGPDAGSPKAERDLFELADDDEPAAGSVLEHVFTADAPEAVDALGDVLDESPLPGDEPGEPTSAFSAVLGDDAPSLVDLYDGEPAPEAVPVVEAPAPAPAPPAPAPALAYEPPATLAEALLDAPDAPPADLRAHDDWALAGLAPERRERTAEVADAGALRSTWRRENDDLLPARGRGRRAR